MVINRIQMVLFLIIASLTFPIIGCDKSDISTNKSPKSTANGLKEDTVPKMFILSDEDIERVAIYDGDETKTTELDSRADITTIIKYFNAAQGYSGNSTADLNRYVAFKQKNGNTITLQITGTWSIFIDEKTKQAYQINDVEPSFIDWIAEIEKR